MKILKPGRPQKGWSTEAVCTGRGNGGGGCSAKLLVEQADLFTTQSSARDEVTTYVTFQCCGCGVLTDLPDAAQPPHAVIRALPDHNAWKQGAR